MSAESIEGTLLCLRAQEEGWNPLVALHYIYTVSKPYPALPCPSSRCDFSSLLLPSLTLCETSFLSFRPGLGQARSCLRAFAQTVLPAGNRLPQTLLSLPPLHCLGLSAALPSQGAFPDPLSQPPPTPREGKRRQTYNPIQQ